MRFYGWKIVAVAFLSLFISVGFSFYSYGAFFKAIAQDFGGSRLGVGLGLSVMFLVTGLFAPFLGRALDRGLIRKIMAFGALLMAVGFLLISRIDALWQFYLVLGTFLALGAAMVGGLPASTLVSNWFVRQRGMALGIATMGISLSGMVMAPTATQLIEAIGWRGAFVVYGSLTLIIVLPVVWFGVIKRPEDLGLLPDGDTLPVDPREAEEPVVPLAPGDQIIDHPADFHWSTQGVLTDRNFWAIALAISLNFCANGAMLTHIIPHATDMGFHKTRAALVLSCIAGMGVLGKILWGFVADRIDKRAALLMASACQAAAVVLLIRVSEYRSLLGVGAIFGLGMGGLVPLWGSLVGAAFGRQAFGRVMGLMGPVMLPLQILGIPFAGYVFDRVGSYVPAFRTFVWIYLAAMGAVLLLRLPEVEPGSFRGPGGATANGKPAPP